MTHIDPEDDADATRTLFVGNIDATVSEDEIRHLFKKYGIVEDIDMKRNAQARQVRGGVRETSTTIELRDCPSLLMRREGNKAQRATWCPPAMRR